MRTKACEREREREFVWAKYNNLKHKPNKKMERWNNNFELKIA